MARTVAECNQYIVNNLVTQFASVGITIDPNNWSKRNLLRNICYAFAIAQALFEQLADQSIAEMEDIQSKSVAATKPWIQDKMRKFQYSATDPQVLQLVNNVPQYPEVKEDLQIITACSVYTTVQQQVIIKVAKGSPFAALATGELTAAQDYIDTIGTAGIVYVVTSTAADRLYIKANVYYQGIYAAVIQTTVIDAINAFLTDLSETNFDGYLFIAKLLEAIRSVEGVNDVALEDVSARYSAQAFGAGTDLVVGFDLLQRRYLTGAGYIIEEDTAGETFADKITFIAE